MLDVCFAFSFFLNLCVLYFLVQIQPVRAVMGSLTYSIKPNQKMGWISSQVKLMSIVMKEGVELGSEGLRVEVYF